MHEYSEGKIIVRYQNGPLFTRPQSAKVAAEASGPNADKTDYSTEQWGQSHQEQVPEDRENPEQSEEDMEEAEEEVPPWVLALSTNIHSSAHEEEVFCPDEEEEATELVPDEEEEERQAIFAQYKTEFTIRSRTMQVKAQHEAEEKLEHEAVFTQYSIEFSTPSKSKLVAAEMERQQQAELEREREALFAQYKAEFATRSKTRQLIDQLDQEREFNPGFLDYDDSKLPNDIPDYEVLATFTSETEGVDTGLCGSDAIIYSTYGQGRVLCISPHPESTYDWGTSRRCAVKQRKEELLAISRVQRIVQRAVVLVATDFDVL